jgi:hypothetical protein
MAAFDIAVSNVLRSLQRLQYGHDERILLFTQDPVGLGGQIARRLQGLKLALFLDRKVAFPHLDEPPYGSVFEPIHSPVEYSSELTKAVDFFAENAASAETVKLDFWDLVQSRSLAKQVYFYLPPQFANIQNPRLFFDGLLLTFCKLTFENARVVKDAAERLEIGEGTLGVHIRRGDKGTETPFVPLGIINEQIERTCGERGFHRIFVSSDDPSVFSKVRVPPDVDLVFDDTEKRYNNANHRLLRRNPELSAQETATAVKNIFLLGQCGGIVGQSNAHFALLAAARIAFRNHGEIPGKLIDGDCALQGSKSARAIHATKLAIRSAGRKLFPWLTIRYRKTRISR